MFKSEKKVTLEWLKEKDEKGMAKKLQVMSNPIYDNDKISTMVKNILDNEIPRLNPNSSLYNLIIYTVTEKLKTVQTVENVLSYIKENNVKTVQDISFKNGEVRIKCST